MSDIRTTRLCTYFYREFTKLSQQHSTVYGAVEVFLTSKLIQARAPVLTHAGRVSE